MSVGALLVTVFLLAANAFFVAVEFALIASRKTRLEAMADDGSMLARRALEQSRELSLQLAGAQLGITMASLLLGYVAEPAIGHALEAVFHDTFALSEPLSATLGFVVGLTIVVILHMVLGEMVPKNIAIAQPERTMLALVLPNRAYVFLFRPVIRFLNAVANGIVRLLGVEPQDEIADHHTADELAAMVADSRREGLLGAVENRLLSGALRIGAHPVREIMIPRSQIESVRRSATPAEVEASVTATGHSRLLVVDDHIDDVVGYLHAKDLLTIPEALRDRPLPLGRIRPLPVVAPATPVDDVLVAMRRARVHLSVVNEGGRTLGLVALEDVLEELVGDILDESDRPAARTRRSVRSEPVGASPAARTAAGVGDSSRRGAQD